MGRVTLGSMSRPSLGGANVPVDDHREPSPVEKTDSPHDPRPRSDYAGQSEAWRRSLRTDWLPIALVGGDALIAGASFLIGYSLRYRFGETQVLAVEPYVAALPGLMIFLTSMCFNLMSDGLRSAMDVRL